METNTNQRDDLEHEKAYIESLKNMEDYYFDVFSKDHLNNLPDFTELVEKNSETQKKFFESGELKDKYNSYLQNMNSTDQNTAYVQPDKSLELTFPAKEIPIITQVKSFYQILALRDIFSVQKKKKEGHYHYKGEKNAAISVLKSMPDIDYLNPNKQNHAGYLTSFGDLCEAYMKFTQDPLDLVRLANFTSLAYNTAVKQYFHVILVRTVFSYIFQKYMANNVQESIDIKTIIEDKLTTDKDDENKPTTDKDDETTDKQIELHYRLMTVQDVYNFLYEIKEKSQNFNYNYYNNPRYKTESYADHKERTVSMVPYKAGSSRNTKLKHKKTTRKRNKSMYKQKRKNSQNTKLSRKKTTRKIR